MKVYRYLLLKNWKIGGQWIYDAINWYAAG